jgi:hypothetical protein
MDQEKIKENLVVPYMQCAADHEAAARLLREQAREMATLIERIPVEQAPPRPPKQRNKDAVCATCIYWDKGREQCLKDASVANSMNRIRSLSDFWCGDHPDFYA